MIKAQLEPDETLQTSSDGENSSIHNSKDYLKVWWPVLLEIVCFILYVLSVWSYYNPSAHLFFLFWITAPFCMIVAPALAVLQFVYGVVKTNSNLARGTLHIASSLTLAVLCVLFYMFAVGAYYFPLPYIGAH